jgi:hypothetical protein
MPIVERKKKMSALSDVVIGVLNDVTQVSMANYQLGCYNHPSSSD